MSKKPPLPPVTQKTGKVNVRKLKLPQGPITPKPGSMLIEKKIKRSKGLT